jgi:hypothetical protein
MVRKGSAPSLEVGQSSRHSATRAVLGAAEPYGAARLYCAGHSRSTPNSLAALSGQ